MRIFLVEDEKSLAELLSSYLREAGYDVTVFNDGLLAKGAIDQSPDLWVLDIMLPGLDGYGLIKEIKKATPDTPVIFSSARSAELDRVIGLEMGSDDYLPKPFLPRELVLRVERLLGKKTKVAIEGTVLLGPCVFDINKRTIAYMDDTYALSVKEFDLLVFMVEHKDTALSRNDILDQVWGTDYFGSDRVIDDTIRRLKKKVPLQIENVYGFGYILKET